MLACRANCLTHVKLSTQLLLPFMQHTTHHSTMSKAHAESFFKVSEWETECMKHKFFTAENIGDMTKRQELDLDFLEKSGQSFMDITRTNWDTCDDIITTKSKPSSARADNWTLGPQC